VDDHRDLARGDVEAVLQAQSQVLKLVEGALRAVGVVRLVARGEAERMSLDPGDGSSLREPEAVSYGTWTACWNVGRLIHGWTG
jgi:hypothetical protein